MELVLKNLKSILISLFLVAFAIIVYLNSSKLVNWFKSLFTNVSTDDLPTTKDLHTTTYVIENKIIDNYVETIINAIDQFGCDEKALDNVYKILNSTDISNTLAVWNNFKNRNLKYSSASSHFESGFFLGKTQNLHSILKSELTGLFVSQSKKNAWTNWDHLLREKAHLV